MQGVSCRGEPPGFAAGHPARQASGQDPEQRSRSALEECKDDVVESRDDKQGGEKQGKSTNKAPSVDLPASDFVCFSHFFTHNATCSPGAHGVSCAK